MAGVWRSQCVFARYFNGKTGRILNNAPDFGTKLSPDSIRVLAANNYSNYAHSPFVRRITEQYEFEIEKNPVEWSYVERLLPFKTIPQFKPKESYPSGFIPPKEEAKNLPYFMRRTKNLEIPIYLDISCRGQKKVTKIGKIEGDIWLMNEDLKSFLKKTHDRYVETRVHELGRFIEVKGDFATSLLEWAHSKGF